MAKIRHLAFICEEPKKVGEFLSKAFGLDILYHTEPSGTTVLSDGVINITLLTKVFNEHDPAMWHFGIEMTPEELEERKPILAELGAELNQGVQDGRPVEAYLRTPEGHRIDIAPFWPTQPGQRRRNADVVPTEDGKPHTVVVKREVTAGA